MRGHIAYPAQLAALLGEGYDVRNFGVGGTTLLFSGDKPYHHQQAFKAAMEFNPNLVLLLLGANDTCSAPRGNWEKSADFIHDARTLLRELRRSGRRVLDGLPPPPGRSASP